MNKYIAVVVGILSLWAVNGSAQNLKAARGIEKMILAGVDKALSSSVYIIEYDTLKNKVQEGVEEDAGFTGVVVTVDGHILTVSHAATPNQVYRVSFPNGNQHIAVGLGRIGIQRDSLDLDMAMLKILKPGKWRVAEMALGSDLKVGQAVISIAYPGSFFKSQPNVRYGQVTALNLHGGFVESTAKMEPGDSGGPLFDELGRLVGIHSWIKEAEDKNYDVPTDSFLKYWSALNVARDYDELPDADVISAVNVSKELLEPVSHLEDILKTDKKNAGVVLHIKSRKGAEELSILGTLVAGKLPKEGKSYVLSKSSMVFDNPQVLGGGQMWAARVLKRDRKNDLVLLEIPTTLAGGVDLMQVGVPKKDGHPKLGQLLLSQLPNEKLKNGVLSSLAIDMPLRMSVGNFGAGASFIDGKIMVTRIQEEGATDDILKIEDQVLAINGTPTRQPSDYGNELSKYMVGDTIAVDIVRGGAPMCLHVFLQGYPKMKHVSFDYEGGRSLRSDGFKKVLVQDAAIKADECAGPVFDLSGGFVGINIARHSRTSTIILPTEILKEFMDSFDL